MNAIFLCIQIAFTFAICVTVTVKNFQCIRDALECWPDVKFMFKIKISNVLKQSFMLIIKNNKIKGRRGSISFFFFIHDLDFVEMVAARWQLNRLALSFLTQYMCFLREMKMRWNMYKEMIKVWQFYQNIWETNEGCKNWNEQQFTFIVNQNGLILYYFIFYFYPFEWQSVLFKQNQNEISIFLCA